MKIRDLENDPDVIDWLDLIDARPNTRSSYIKAMSKYTEYHGVTPLQLLNEARDDIRAGKTVSERSIRRRLVGFRKHLVDCNLAPLTVKNHIVGVVSFYRTNDIDIPKLQRSHTKARPLEQHNEIPTKELLQEVLKVADPVEKALVLAGCSSGLSTNELIRITVGQFNEGYDDSTGITTIRMRREKVGVDFITFFSPEASLAVLDYLKYRMRAGDKYSAHRAQSLEKQRITSDNGRLFVMQRIPDTYLETRDEILRAFDNMSIPALYRRLSAKTGKDTNKNVWNTIRSHNMRKYFNSALLNAGCDSFFVEFFMGHTLDDTRSAYFRASPEKLKDIYIKYVPALTIAPELRIEDSLEYQKAIEENTLFASERGRISLASDMANRRITQLEEKIARIEEGNRLYSRAVKLRPELLDE